MIDEKDIEMMLIAFNEAQLSINEGGLPIGSVLTENGNFKAKGHNQRVQNGNPIAHGEMDCLMNAGRMKSYRNTTLYTTLSPCMMCSGTIVQFKIPRIVIGENVTFEGNIEFF